MTARRQTRTEGQQLTAFNPEGGTRLSMARLRAPGDFSRRSLLPLFVSPVAATSASLRG